MSSCSEVTQTTQKGYLLMSHKTTAKMHGDSQPKLMTIHKAEAVRPCVYSWAPSPE